MTILAERGRNNKRPLVIENIDQTVMVEVAKVLDTINLNGKYSSAINNSNIDVAEDLRLNNIKIYWRCVGQIQDKVDWLYKD